MALNGIDVSSWQKGINLKAVPADFVICKATEGTSYISIDFERQMKQAKSAGKLLGVYHYANGGDAIAEADYFIKTIKNYIGEAMLFLDWESQNNKKWNKATESAFVSQFMKRVQDKTGIKPLLYVQASAINRFKGYDLWVAQYANMNPTGYQNKPWNEGKYNCVLRQYSSTGTLSGYGKYLDLNKFYGTAADWKRYAGAGTIASFTVEELADKVIAGEFGTGEARKQALGDMYDEVQAIVNERLKTAGNAVKYHTVKKGETVTSIAKKYKTTVQEVTRMNGLKDPNIIKVGQKLRVK